MSCIHVLIQNQILSNNLDCIYCLRVLVFLFFHLLFCNGVMVYLRCHRTICILSLGTVFVSVLFSCEFSSQFVFILLLFFFLCLLSVSILVFFLPVEIFCFQVWGRLCTDGALWSPSTQFF